MKKISNVLSDIFIRYFLVFLLGFGNLYVFYIIFTPLTSQVIYFLLTLFGETIIKDGIFYFNNFDFKIIGACVAGAAYYLLFVLVMISGAIKWKKRIMMLLFGFISLFLLNVLRIFVLVHLYWSVYFSFIHWWLWHVFSILLVVGIWFLMVKIFKIKSVPFVTDFKYILKLSKKS